MNGEIDREVFVHGAMIYECDKCGKKWRMWLECGVGSCNSDKSWRVCKKCEVSDGVMTMPFMIRCLCGGTAKHINWHKDSRLPHPMPINKDMSYFRLDREGIENKNPEACGIPIVRKNSRDLRQVPQ